MRSGAEEGAWGVAVGVPEWIAAEWLEAAAWEVGVAGALGLLDQLHS